MNFRILLHHFSKKIIVYCFILLIASSCTADKLSPSLHIRVQYYYHPPLSGQKELMSGLKWYLSYLGAALEPGQLNNAIKWERNSSNYLELDFSKLGFPKHSQTALKHIITSIKNSTAYQTQNSIDLGRLVMLTLNSSHHYYAITGVYSSYSAFKQAYQFEDSAHIIFNNGESTITSGNRIIFKTKDPINNFLDMAFIAKEGVGIVQQGTFKSSDFEVFDFMENGQPRFAIYDNNGQLKTAVPPSLGEAGKPAKCMWCHESSIQFNFAHVHPQTASFNQFVQRKRDYLDSSRQLLPSDLSYELLQEHRFAELLYISFMEPTAKRLAHEWNYSLSETLNLLQNYPTHINHEYPQLGTLYDRADIDHLNPYSVLKVPESEHEASAYEPNF